MKRAAKGFSVVLILGLLMSQPAFATDDTGLFRRIFEILAPVVRNTEATVKTVFSLEREEQVDRGHLAYVVSANQRLNMETGKYYGELSLINETGLFFVQTIEDVENYNFLPVFTTDRIGKISEWEGKFVQFDMRGTDKIQKLETRWSPVQNAFSGEDGLYLVNIASERNGIVFFYDTASEVSNVQGTPAESLEYHEKGGAVVSIYEGVYMGDHLEKISAKTERLSAGKGNAVIQVYEGKILRIFSFAE